MLFKNIIQVIFGVILLATLSSQAEDKSNGCGLGWKVSDRNSLLSSLVRTYTNALTSSTSGMTSGTSGCQEHSIVKNDKASLLFAESNYENLMVDFAKGEGDYAGVYAYTLGCSETAEKTLLQKTKQNFDKLFPHGGGAIQMHQNVKDMIKDDSELSVSCKPLS